MAPAATISNMTQRDCQRNTLVVFHNHTAAPCHTGSILSEYPHRNHVKHVASEAIFRGTELPPTIRRLLYPIANPVTQGSLAAVASKRGCAKRGLCRASHYRSYPAGNRNSWLVNFPLLSRGSASLAPDHHFRRWTMMLWICATTTVPDHRKDAEGLVEVLPIHGVKCYF